MANPYHDETGKFCSKTEMRTALDRLYKAKNFDGYFSLRQDYDAIEEENSKSQMNTIDALEQALGTVAPGRSSGQHSGVPELIAGVSEPDALRSLAGTLDSSAQNAIAFLNNPNTPDDVRDKILKDLSPASQKYVINNNQAMFNNNKVDLKREDLINLANNLPDDANGKAVLGFIVDSPVITESDAKEFANKLSHSTLRYYRARGWSENDPEFENEALKILQKGGVEVETSLAWEKDDNDYRIYYNRKRLDQTIKDLKEDIALKGTSATLETLVKDYDHSFEQIDLRRLYQMAPYFVKNENITPNVAKVVMTEPNIDVVNYSKLSKTLKDNKGFSPAAKSALSSSKAVPLAGAADDKTIAAAAEAKNVYAEVRRRKGRYANTPAVIEGRYNKYVSARAAVDAHSDNYKKLSSAIQRAETRYASGEITVTAYNNLIERKKFADEYLTMKSEQEILSSL